MPEYPFDPVEAFWDALFSRDPRQIQAVYDPLDEQTRQSVIAHLVRMVSEPNWHPEQVKSARAALETLKGVQFPENSEVRRQTGVEAALPRFKPARKRHAPKTARD